MAETEWVRVSDTRTKEILPHLVPRKHLQLFPHLREVPSARRKADRVVLTEPVQPHAMAPGAEDVQEPDTTAARGKGTTPIKEEN